MSRRGIPCPRVVKLRKHVLVMSFIGRDGRAAPQLREAQMEPVDWELCYDQVCTVSGGFLHFLENVDFFNGRNGMF